MNESARKVTELLVRMHERGYLATRIVLTVHALMMYLMLPHFQVLALFAHMHPYMHKTWKEMNATD